MKLSDYFYQECDRFNFYFNYTSSKNKRNLYLIIYTFLFVVTYFIVFSPFFIYHKTFIDNTTGIPLYYPLTIFFGNTISQYIYGVIHNGDFAFPLYSLTAGLGFDTMRILGIGGSNNPLLMLNAIVPPEYKETLYASVIFVHLYLIGLSFSYMCRYFGSKYRYILIGALIYTFSSYAIYNAMLTPFAFLPPLIQFPLLIVGLEKILRKEKPYIFIFSMALTAYFGFYFLYMMTIFLFIYAITRFFDLYKENRIKNFLFLFLRVTGFYILGIWLVAPIFIPALLGYFESSRSGGEGNYAQTSTIFYTFRNLIRKYIYMVAPPGDVSNLSLPAITIFSFAALFVTKGRRHIKILALVMFLLFSTYIGGRIMNGFQYAALRWVFCFVLLLSFIVVQMLPDLMKMERKHFAACFIIFVLYSSLYFSSSIYRRLDYMMIGAFFLACTIFTLMWQRYAYYSYAMREKEEKRFTAPLFMLVALIICNISINAMYRIHPDLGNRIAKFGDKGKETKNIMNSIQRDIRPYLPSNIDGRIDIPIRNQVLNIWGIPMMFSYNSNENGHVIKFYNAIEHSVRWQFYNIQSSGGFTIPTTLLSQKYFASKNENPYDTYIIPFGYEFKRKTAKKTYIYENKYALPWGYTYENTISYDDLKGLNGLQVQDAMLQAVALEKSAAGVPKQSEILFFRDKIPFNIKYSNCEWKNGVFRVFKKNAYIALTFNSPENTETSVRFNNFDMDGSNVAITKITALSEGKKQDVSSTSKKYTWYDRRKNLIFNLGYSDKERRTVKIYFKERGRFRLNDIEIYSFPMDNYVKYAEELRKESLKNIKWEKNSISGSVDLSKDKILALSIPFDKGWTAYVDGKKAEILRGNYMFMCLHLKAGHHEIVFKYFTYGLKPGLILFFISIAALIALILQDRKKKMKKAV